MQGELENLYVDTGAWRVLYIDNMCCSQIRTEVWILKEHYFDSSIDPALDHDLMTNLCSLSVIPSQTPLEFGHHVCYRNLCLCKL